ncbi:carboxypeptidase-like regulatory domain-containing protein [Fulvivirga maritima]|uniref:energy transducer TonB n=1 Tax=Fulvivirga maritima TaxID=2904247 RepID=UPI001F38B58C|nr:carboxypeptidase-like regulatory domain-containing protein [Fulvivirga maritima]UII28814.1 carboxypeptidase-like regulatory domain-containing protein [Fulvivirga maritima]
MKDNNHHTEDLLTPELMEKYLNDELSHMERNRVEKLMLNNDFEAEAMEGFEQYDGNMPNDLQALNQQLDSRIKTKKKTFPIWLKVAASLLLIAVALTFVFQYEGVPTQENTAQNSDSSLEKKETTEDQEPAQNTSEQDNSDSLLALQKTPLAAEPIEEESIEPQAPAAASQPAIKARKRILSKDEATPAPPKVSTLDVEEAELSEIAFEADTLIAPTPNLQGRLTGTRIPSNELVKASADVKEPLPNKTPKENFPKVITGVIKDENGSPLAGVNVIIAGTSTGTISDTNGEYTIVSPDNIQSRSLIFSSIGLTSKEISIDDQSEIDVELKNEIAQLSEVVVTGYGKTKRAKSYSKVEPEGGMDAFEQYIEENIQYPKDSLKGNVVITFDVVADGELSNFEIKKSLGKAYDDEAIRLIKEGPAWKPASRNSVSEKENVKVKIKFNPTP